MADGTGIAYEDEEEVYDLTTIDGETVNLYAIYTAYRYVHNGDIVFDGTNYIDTEIAVFSAENVNRNFEISFEIKERISASEKITIMNAMDESGEPWPGICYRISKSTQDTFLVNVTKGNEYVKEYDKSIVSKVTIRRVNGILSIEFNDNEDPQPTDIHQPTNVSTIATFNTPVTFGASLTGGLVPQRFFKGTLSNLSVHLYENGTSPFATP